MRKAIAERLHGDDVHEVCAARVVRGERASENMHGSAPPNSSPQCTRLSCVSPSRMRSEGRREISKLARLRISRVRPSRR